MPVTKTAKRALRSSKRKEEVNKQIRANLEVAIRLAKKGKTRKRVTTAISLADRAAKKHLIHKNKAARIKSTLSKLLPKQKTAKSKAQKKSKPFKKK
jgi:small subunit ribosomal protein S20